MRKEYTGQLFSCNLQPWYQLCVCPLSKPYFFPTLWIISQPHKKPNLPPLYLALCPTPQNPTYYQHILSRTSSPGSPLNSHFLSQNCPSWPALTTDWLNLLLTELNKHKAQNYRSPLKQANCSQPSVHITISWRALEKYGYSWITPDQLNEILREIQRLTDLIPSQYTGRRKYERGGEKEKAGNRDTEMSSRI